MSESIEIRIRGHVFKLKSKASGEYVRELAQYVNDMIGQVPQESHVASSERTAMMAALRIADEYLQHRRFAALQTDAANANIEKISRLIVSTDQLLKG